jgi:hypothetical protein
MEHIKVYLEYMSSVHDGMGWIHLARGRKHVITIVIVRIPHKI